ncbi:MAG: multidrug efflux SMR transporter [Dehalococcoidia bacterium]|nr:multidrug efflux SMR transporter [Dehalococcoidia bacterium]
MAWAILFVAGLIEVAWAISLKYADGFTKPIPSALSVAAIIVSMVLLSVAARTLPIGTAYAVFVGMGAVGAAVLGVILFDEPVTVSRVGFLVLLGIAVVGLQATSST